MCVRVPVKASEVEHFRQVRCRGSFQDISRRLNRLLIDDKERLYCFLQARHTVEAFLKLTLQEILGQEVNEAEALCLSPVLPPLPHILEVRGGDCEGGFLWGVGSAL